MVINPSPASGQSWRSDGSLDSVCVEIAQVKMVNAQNRSGAQFVYDTGLCIFSRSVSRI